MDNQTWNSWCVKFTSALRWVALLWLSRGRYKEIPVHSRQAWHQTKESIPSNPNWWINQYTGIACGTFGQTHHKIPTLEICLPNRTSERGRPGEDPLEALWDSLGSHDAHTLQGGNFHENHHDCSAPRWWWLCPDPWKQLHCCNQKRKKA